MYGKAFGSECFEDYFGEFVSITFLSCFEMEKETEDPEVRIKRAWEKMGVCFLGWCMLSKSEFSILLINSFFYFYLCVDIAEGKARKAHNDYERSHSTIC